MNEDFESIRQYKANQRRAKRQAEARVKRSRGPLEKAKPPKGPAVALSTT